MVADRYRSFAGVGISALSNRSLSGYLRYRSYLFAKYLQCTAARWQTRRNRSWRLPPRRCRLYQRHRKRRQYPRLPLHHLGPQRGNASDSARARAPGSAASTRGAGFASRAVVTPPLPASAWITVTPEGGSDKSGNSSTSTSGSASPLGSGSGTALARGHLTGGRWVARPGRPYIPVVDKRADEIF